MSDVYTDRMDREAREDEDYGRFLDRERSDRRREHASVALPAREEYPVLPACSACGAPRGSRCAGYCTEKRS